MLERLRSLFASKPKDAPNKPHCSMCGAERYMTRYLVESPRVSLCATCVDTFARSLAEARQKFEIDQLKQNRQDN